MLSYFSNSPAVASLVVASIVAMGEVVLATGSLPAASISLRVIDDDWKQCLQKDTIGSDRYIIECHNDTRERVFALLDQVLASQRGLMSKAELRKSELRQAKWLKSAMRTCERDSFYRFNGGGTKYTGTAARVIYGFCIIDAAHKRVSALLGDAP